MEKFNRMAMNPKDKPTCDFCNDTGEHLCPDVAEPIPIPCTKKGCPTQDTPAQAKVFYVPDYSCSAEAVDHGIKVVRADEFDRVCAENAELKEDAAKFEEWSERQSAQYHKVCAELASVKAERDAVCELIDGETTVISNLVKERDDLKREVEELKMQLASSEPDDERFTCDDVVMLLKDDVKKLRQALEKCAEPHRWHAPCLSCGPKITEAGCYIARAALAGKGDV